MEAAVPIYLGAALLMLVSQPPAAQLGSSPTVRAYLTELLQLAGWGYRDGERAAFLVTDGGGLRCLVWPYHTALRGERYRGRIPPGTVAVLHTHPNAIPRPSIEDREEARRVRLPFLVASSRHIYAVTTTGEIAAVVVNEWWPDRVGRGREPRCEPLPPGR